MSIPDCVIRGGRVIDPFNNIDADLTDVAIRNGKIFDVGKNLPHGVDEVIMLRLNKLCTC